MFVSFDTMPGESRVWVYQAPQELTDAEQRQVLATGRQFLDQWVSHGQPLAASMEILEGYFVIIAVDDRLLPSGCSIDASVGFMRELGSQLHMDFFQRTNVPLWIKDSVQIMPLTELRTRLKDGLLSEDTLIINTLVQNKDDLKNWVIPIKKSWLARYLGQPQNN